MARTLQTIWCDDIRMEVGNKMSLMGIYSAELLVPTFPFVLQKLCLSCKISADIKKPFKQLKIVVSKNDEVVAEIDMTESVLQQSAESNHKSAESNHIKDNAKFIAVQSFFVLGQMTIDKPVTFRAKAISDTDVIKGHGLRVELAPQNVV